MKKRWIYVTVMVGLLTLAVTGGVAAANFGGGGAADDMNTRAAEILGVEPQALSDALEQAHEEVMAAQLQARLDEAVVEGLITQEQADEYSTWIQDRPDGLDHDFGRRGGRGHGRGGPGFGKTQRFNGSGGFGHEAPADDTPAPTSFGDSF
jgi:hypothetical protein